MFKAFSFLVAVSCGVPKAPVNGGVLAVDYSVGTRVSYFCNDGYRLSSKELTSAVCQPDGTWSNHNKIPRCSGIRPILRRNHKRTHTHRDVFIAYLRAVATHTRSPVTTASPLLYLWADYVLSAKTLSYYPLKFRPRCLGPITKWYKMRTLIFLKCRK